MARKKRQAVYSDGAEEEEAEEAEELEKPHLKGKQAAFVFQFTRGKYSGNAAQSAKAAGYGAKNCQQIAWALVKHPKIANAIDAVLRDEIGKTLTVQALNVIRFVITNDNAPLKLRANCACKVIEYSGIIERIRIEKANETGLNAPSDGPKRLGEMSRDELESVVRNGAALLQAAAALPPAPVTLDANAKAESIPDKRKSLMASTA